MILQKTNVDGYMKDSKTGAVINTREWELLEYNRSVSQHKEMIRVQNDVNSLKNDLNEIKTMLSQILKKSN